jgi:outer membrane protein OmpA-like peptidoglycan-associated protein
MKKLIFFIFLFLYAIKSFPQNKPEHLGKEINSMYDEVLPVISSDGKTLYFSRFDHPQNTGGAKAGQDIWYSTLNDSAQWSAARNMGSPLNNNAGNFILSAFPDGNGLLVGGNYHNDNNPISISHKTHETWGIPESQIIKGLISTSETFFFSMGSDRKTLIIQSQGPDTRGEQDLYVSFLDHSGKWTKPMNLGPVVNSQKSEITPFLAADGKSLYFSSNGRAGLGKYDIYVSKRLDDTWQKWSVPKSLGPNINTKGSDAYYNIPASGDYAYYVSNFNSLGHGDIFRIRLHEDIKPHPVIAISGKVLDKKDNQPIGAKISFYNLNDTIKEQGIAMSNTKTGEYKIILPCGSNYGYRAEAEGYIAMHENMDLIKINEYKEIKQNLYLIPIEIGGTVQLNNVFFEIGESILINTSYAELDELIKILTNKPTLEIEIQGHTDNHGDEKMNMVLSENRARVVKEYLIANGISESRVISKGYGSSHPLASNDDEETRKLNRRVNFVITKK